MNKKLGLSLVLSTIILVGCSGGGGGSDSDGTNTDTGGSSLNTLEQKSTDALNDAGLSESDLTTLTPKEAAAKASIALSYAETWSAQTGELDTDVSSTTYTLTRTYSNSSVSCSLGGDAVYNGSNVMKMSSSTTTQDVDWTAAFNTCSHGDGTYYGEIRSYYSFDSDYPHVYNAEGSIVISDEGEHYQLTFTVKRTEVDNTFSTLPYEVTILDHTCTKDLATPSVDFSCVAN